MDLLGRGGGLCGVLLVGFALFAVNTITLGPGDQGGGRGQGGYSVEADRGWLAGLLWICTTYLVLHV